MMTENKERRLPRIVATYLGGIQRSWNEFYYGFSGGKPSVDRVNSLLRQEKLNLDGMREMALLLGESKYENMRLRMVAKIGEGIEWLLEDRRLPQMDMQAQADYLDRVAKGEGLD